MKKRGKAKRNLKLYALIMLGQNGPFHSIDYPKVWSTRAAAKRYKKTVVLEVQQPIYQIVEFVAVGGWRQERER